MCQFFGTNNSLVRRHPCGAETGKLCIDSVALQDVGSRHRFSALLVGHRSLRYRPVNAPDRPVGLVGHILETAVNHCLERVEPRLRSSLRHVPAAPLPRTSASLPALLPAGRGPLSIAWSRACRFVRAAFALFRLSRHSLLVPIAGLA